jgi:glycerol-3-phosphate dehydrogenase subunit C
MSWLADLRSGKKSTESPNRKKYAYHAPCHLCAIGQRGKSLDLLKDVTGIVAKDLDSGCCGLAGTCGMQKKNRRMQADIARDMVRAIEANNPDMILTECAACKMQIEHLTGKTVLHPVKLLRNQDFTAK